MPELDGYATTERLHSLAGKKQGSFICPLIVAVTANAMQGDRERCLASGMDDYLAKPVRLPQLKATLERCTMRLSGRDLMEQANYIRQLLGFG